jgi:YggT family protein
MGAVAAFFGVLADAISSVQHFITVFVSIYTIVIFIYILTSWVRLPYSPTMNRVQRFLYDVCEPYIRLFRKILPSLGPLDLSPMVAVIVLWIFERVAVNVLGRFH